MDTAVIVAIIGAAASLFTSALIFFLTKKKEREADWRRLKLARYDALLASINDLADNPRNGVSFAKAANDVNLVASAEVLTALQSFIDYLAAPHYSTTVQNQYFTALIYAIRKDLCITPVRGPDDLILKLYCGRRSKTV